MLLFYKEMAGKHESVRDIAREKLNDLKNNMVNSTAYTKINGTTYVLTKVNIKENRIEFNGNEALKNIFNYRVYSGNSISFLEMVDEKNENVETGNHYYNRFFATISKITNSDSNESEFWRNLSSNNRGGRRNQKLKTKRSKYKKIRRTRRQ